MTVAGASLYVTNPSYLARLDLDIANSIVAGNRVLAGAGATGPDVCGTITASNGHNLFGSHVAAASPATARTLPPAPSSPRSTPTTGGGKLNASGIVPLKQSVANPALSGGDPLAAGATGQLGINPRPLPAGSLPDIGAVESDQPLSTGPTSTTT